ncbi:MAG: FecR family protein [Candidatus Cryptobacteroides sp.]
MSSGDYRQIFDFFFSGAEIPEDLQEEFRNWLSRHGDDERVIRILEGHWDSFPTGAGDFDLPAHLEELHRRIERENVRSTRKNRVWKGFAATIAAAVVFAFGFFATNIAGINGKETIIMASDESIGKYSLPDGTRVWLNKDSYLRYDSRFDRRTRTVTLEGEGFFEVTRNEDKPFIIRMNGNMEVKVLGTSFNACGYNGENNTDIILRNGSVQIADKTSGERVILKPNQRFSRKDGQTEVSYVRAEECCRWYEKVLAFDNVALRDILETLSHRYRIGIKSNLGSLADKRMSLTVKDESLENVMDILSTLLPIKWSIREKDLYLERNH